MIKLTCEGVHLLGVLSLQISTISLQAIDKALL